MANFLTNLGVYLARPVVTQLSQDNLRLEEENYKLRLKVSKLEAQVKKLTPKKVVKK